MQTSRSVVLSRDSSNPPAWRRVESRTKRLEPWTCGFPTKKSCVERASGMESSVPGSLSDSCRIRPATTRSEPSDSAASRHVFRYPCSHPSSSSRSATKVDSGQMPNSMRRARPVLTAPERFFVLLFRMHSTVRSCSEDSRTTLFVSSSCASSQSLTTITRSGHSVCAATDASAFVREAGLFRVGMITATSAMAHLFRQCSCSSRRARRHLFPALPPHGQESCCSGLRRPVAV